MRRPRRTNTVLRDLLLTVDRVRGQVGRLTALREELVLALRNDHCPDDSRTGRRTDRKSVAS